MCNSRAIITTPNADDPLLFPPQAELLRAGFFNSTEHWLICAPTGSGKTRIGEWGLLSAIQGGMTGVYLAPLKAIVEERVADWSQRFPDISIGLFTGDRFGQKNSGKPADHDMLLLTPEKLSSYLNNWKSHLSWISRIGTLVVDEVHLLGDSSRGAGLECLINRLRRINPFIRIIGLSGTLSNAEEIASWLGARLYTTKWQPIPVEHRIERFSKVSDKVSILIDELTSTVEKGGRALVFTNSRRRSEQLAKTLQEADFRCAFTHAGLTPEKRQSSQSMLQCGEIDVLVTTSSLEMGVNFPARKVIIFDSYGFDGETFGPLPVARYLQAAGRAGRAGLDPYGESVLLLPKWAGSDPDYLSRIPFPISSGLFQKKRRSFELLIEVTGRLSISEAHLATNFGNRSLWHHQGGVSPFGDLVGGLIEAGLLRRDNKGGVYLSETALGRIACQMVVEPATIALLVRFFDGQPAPTEFDLLLVACLASECTPKLGFNFEEIDQIADILLSVPSELLDGTVVRFEKLLGTSNHRSLLSAIKSAVLLHRHISGETLESLAEESDAYLYDLILLRQNLCWVLSVAARVFAYLWSKQCEADPDYEEPEDPSEKPESNHQRICEDLAVMVEYGVPRESIGLVQIPGVGSKRAHALFTAGVRTLQQFIDTTPPALGKILRMKEAPIAILLESARKVTSDQYADDPFAVESIPTLPPSRPSLLSQWPSDIDPYRLRRALELNVDHRSEDMVRVSGGTEPHCVPVRTDTLGNRSYACDCADFAKGNTQCKHVLRARLELLDDEDLMPLLRDLGQGGVTSRPLRYSLGELWMGVGGLYDKYAGRTVDYSGTRFLRKASVGARR